MLQGFLKTYGYDMASLTICILLLLTYHLFITWKIRRNPAYTVQAVNLIARTAWVKHIMENKGLEVLAVQTLRNSTMAATFLASTAILLIIGTLTLSGQGDKLEGTWHTLNIAGSIHADLWLAKLLLILLDLFIAFFSFAMSVRVFNHVGYMINVPLASNLNMITPAHVAVHLNRAGKFYSIGMRAYYYVVPLVFWLFGPHFMLLTTVMLLFVLYRLDRSPKILLMDNIET